ncbi:hypothetical protein Bca101_007558 [Brassica carinata]
MSRKWLTDYPLSPRSGFELLAVKREGILPMISRWFAARSCKDQCEGMNKASRKLIDEELVKRWQDCDKISFVAKIRS